MATHGMGMLRFLVWRQWGFVTFGANETMVHELSAVIA